MLKFVGKFRVFHEILLDGTPSPNKDDLFLKTIAGSQIYRYSKNELALMFTTTNSINKYIPLLKQAGVDIKEYIRGETEAILTFPEKQIDTVAKIMKPQIKGKTIKPYSVKTVRRLQTELENKILKSKK